VGGDLAGAGTNAIAPAVSEGLLVEPLGERNAQAWGELFVRASSPCFCRWWHFEGTKNEWLERCADAAANRVEAEAAIVRADPAALGLVALEGGEAVGWMKLTPRASVPKLRALRIYRALDLGPDDGVWSIGCFLVDPRRRRRKVASALLDAAPAYVRSRGGVAIEAYPRHPHESEQSHLHDDEALMGPESMFTARGYVRVAEGAGAKMYPVYRLVL
jgi:GNAT superfamily N-acetyltransferase